MKHPSIEPATPSRLELTLQRYESERDKRGAGTESAAVADPGRNRRATVGTKQLEAGLASDLADSVCEWLGLDKGDREGPKFVAGFRCAEAWASHVGLFRGISKRLLRKILLGATYTSLSPGEMLVRKGQPLNAISVVMLGELQATLAGLPDPDSVKEEQQLQVAERFALQMQRSRLQALSLVKDSSAASSEKWKKALGKHFGLRWFKKSQERATTKNTMGNQVIMKFGATQHIGRDKVLSAAEAAKSSSRRAVSGALANTSVVAGESGAKVLSISNANHIAEVKTPSEIHVQLA